MNKLQCAHEGGDMLVAALERAQWGENVALKRLGFSQTVHNIMKETWEATLATTVQDALEFRAAFAECEAVSEYSKSEVEVRVLEKTKEVHLLRIQLETALADLEIGDLQHQVLEAQVADQKRIAKESQLARKRLKKKLVAARGEVQQERRALVAAESAVGELRTCLQEEKAARLEADREVQLKLSELHVVNKSHQKMAAQLEQLQQEAARTDGREGVLLELEQELKGRKAELSMLGQEHAAGQKECARLKLVVAQQSRELKAFESGQMTLRETVQSLEEKLAAIEASHAALLAESADLRILCRDAGAQVPEKKAPRKSRESLARNLGGLMEQAAPRLRGGKHGTEQGSKSSIHSQTAMVGAVKAALDENRADGTAAVVGEQGPEQREQPDGALEAGAAAKVERRFSPRLKRPSSAESRAGCATQAAFPAEREAKRARLEQQQGLPSIEEHENAQAARAPLQSLRSNSVGSPASSRLGAAKPARSKRQLAPSASKVLGAPPARPQSKSLFGRAFSGAAFKVPRLLATKGQSSQEADRATLMSP